ncbi:hypothetical protein [Achromobacter xylosoxidans]|jgi:hypothetical protein|uniref:hypothetical protein n=1 Tax=Alcaligenes xylosoxydans xylosoxydans TaxID=85698 RepID=UPI0012BCDB87|nr:hypothetical protein [Achromobacter xylosoxidans]MCH4583704.1 hypothetical protein [Achromobacter xylosoxidans]MCH4596409.1 hypothetical protein [Achromobacter xylosoxidans]QKQ53010.1 hypothetical protein FOC83_08585 [Achromobacter xylosoxidans]QPR97845.1 hypothetical protein I6G72_15445 [Achromobacter xylosoxidans]UON41787.1 hypothetical protein IUJ48_06560 [Achromobacter xylosoxidans]
MIDGVGRQNEIMPWPQGPTNVQDFASAPMRGKKRAALVISPDSATRCSAL